MAKPATAASPTANEIHLARCPDLWPSHVKKSAAAVGTRNVHPTPIMRNAIAIAACSSAPKKLKKSPPL